MKKIINLSDSDLLFPKFDLMIKSNEIKIVSDEIFKELTGNMFIKEVIPQKVEKITNIEEEVKVEKIKKNKLEK